MTTQTLSPISKNELLRNIKIDNLYTKVDYKLYFEKTIAQLKNNAIGPQYWFITDNIHMNMVDCSNDIDLFIPYSKQEWLNPVGAFERCSNLFHPDDRPFVYAAINYAMKYPQNSYMAENEKIIFNIYGRHINKNFEYKMALMQFPIQYFNNKNENESSLVLVTDISHLPILNTSMMTMIDHTGTETKFYKMKGKSQKLELINLPKITKREMEILLLMTKGYTSPQIAMLMKIAYDTVENHKRNLRIKTNTKTAAELISYVYENSLI